MNEIVNKLRCRKCSPEEEKTFEEIKNALPEYIRAIDADILVSESEYAARVNACMSCEYLLYGTTCRYCGCFIQVRALNKKRRCARAVNKSW